MDDVVVDFVLDGVTPALWHQDDVLAADSLDEWRKHPDNRNVSKAGDDRSPPWTWLSYLYHDGTHLACPSGNLMSCLSMAGSRVAIRSKTRGKGGPTSYKQLTQSDLLPATDYFTFLVGGKQIKYADIAKLKTMQFAQMCQKVKDFGFELDVRRARVGQSKHVRVRPKFRTWHISGSLEVTSPDIDMDTLALIFEQAGKVGLFDWRPSALKPGMYGQFVAKLKRRRR